MYFYTNSSEEVVYLLASLIFLFSILVSIADLGEDIASSIYFFTKGVEWQSILGFRVSIYIAIICKEKLLLFLLIHNNILKFK